MNQILTNKLLLDIGGFFVSTTMNTIKKFPNSKLAELFNGNYSLELDKKRRIFMDRNGKYFEYILDGLRNAKLILPEDDFLRKKILEELKFFELNELIEENKLIFEKPVLSFDVKKCGMGIKFSENDTVIEKIANSNTYSEILGKNSFKNNVVQWDITILSENTNWIVIGVADLNEISNDFMGGNNDKGYGISSEKQFYRTSGVNSKDFKINETYTIFLDMKNNELKIKGPDVDVKNEKSIVGKELYPFVILYSVGNSVKIGNFKIKE